MRRAICVGSFRFVLSFGEWSQSSSCTECVLFVHTALMIDFMLVSFQLLYEAQSSGLKTNYFVWGSPVTASLLIANAWVDLSFPRLETICLL